MEGLLIHAVLRELEKELPAQNLGLAFPEEGTAAILLKGRTGRLFNLVLHYRPPTPSLALEPGRLQGEPKTPFQRQLQARVKGPLVEASQLKLDRVAFFRFAGEKGFVDAPPSVLVLEATGRNANLLLLDEEGYVAEGSGENIFFVRDGVIYALEHSVNLEGITRDSVIRIAKDLGYEVQVVRATRDQLYMADEVFMTGTAAEVTPVSMIDWRPIGKGTAGPVALRLREVYLEAVTGRRPEYEGWLTYVNGQ